MTKLKNLRQARNLKLRQIAEVINVKPQTVHKMERVGIHKPVTAMQYAAAFPGLNWKDLIDDPKPKASRSPRA